MIAPLAWIVGQPWALRFLKWGAVALAVGLVLLGVRNSGRQAERVGNLEKAVKAAERRRDVEIDVGRMRPDAVVDELHRDWSRD